MARGPGRPPYTGYVVEKMRLVIINLLSEGKAVPEIAEILGVCEKTVINRLTRTR